MDTLWMKGRLADAQVPFYGDADDETPLRELTGRPIVEITQTDPVSGRTPVVLGDGRRGFLAPDADFVPLNLWTTPPARMPLYSEPDVASAKVATLRAKSLVEQTDAPVEQNGTTWLKVNGPQGESGFLDAKSGLVDRGRQVRLQQNPNQYGTQALLKDGKLLPLPTDTSAAKQDAVKQMLIGAGICVAGLVVTAVTYATASGGGMFLICWGPAIFGAVRFFKGVAAYPSED